MSRRNKSRSGNRHQGDGAPDALPQGDENREGNSRRGRKRGRDGGGSGGNSRLILFGRHPVMMAIANPQRTIHKIWATENTRDEVMAALADAERDDIAVDSAGRTDLDEMLPPGTVHQGMAMHCAPCPSFRSKN